MADWFKCCYHCEKAERGLGCHANCPDYKKAKIKRELERRWLIKVNRAFGANYSPGLRELEHREFIEKHK